MEDLDQSPLVSSSDSPPRPQPAFKYQFVREPEDEEEEEEEEEEDEDEDLEELEVLERKPAAGLSAAPVPTASAAGAPLMDFGNDFVPRAPWLLTSSTGETLRRLEWCLVPAYSCCFH